MDAETIKREASAALDDLEIDATVSNVKQSGDSWYVHFSGDYGQLCDSFQNQFKHDNSPRVIREKIKKHLLGQVTQLRNKGGRRTTKKGFNEEGQPDVGALITETVEQTSRAIGQAIDKTLGFTGETIKSAGDFAETLGNRTADALRSAPVIEPARPAARNVPRESTPRRSKSKAKPRATTKKAKVKRQKVKVSKKVQSRSKKAKGKRQK